MSSNKKVRKLRNLRVKSKRKKPVKKIGIGLILLVALFLLFFPEVSQKSANSLKNESKTMYLASSTNKVELFQLKELEVEGKETLEKVLVQQEEVSRGKKVQVYEQDTSWKYEDDVYDLVLLDNKKYYVKKDCLVTDVRDIVLENTVFIRSTTSVLENIASSKINGIALKGEEIKVLGYDKIEEDGTVHLYKVQNQDSEGYVYGKYITYTKEEALKNYQADIYDPIHGKVKNTYDGGEALKLDFYPNEKPTFENNPMPGEVYALYLNSSSNTIKNIDAYIEFAKTTKINAFVVDIKDNESPAIPAKTFENLSPTNYSHAINSYEDYKEAIQKLKDAGFYVIGRITVFKDSYYVKDHPEDAIMNINSGQPYLHNGSYWPSAYSRNVWYYNVSLAREAVEEFGFNEINFDYVRFPDRMNSVGNTVDLKNTYQEDKAEAIQRFVQYATDILHEMEVYVSIDVFGETTNGTYTTAYGQYWPAISNVADVISGMPYPDHFSAYYYGIPKPWNNPYQLLNTWGRYAMERQNETPNPARVRTWIQAYDVMKHVDSNGLTYGAKEVEEEIRGLYGAGLRGGYITWLSNSNLEKYRTQVEAFQIDYGKEYTSE